MKSKATTASGGNRVTRSPALSAAVLAAGLCLLAVLAIGAVTQGPVASVIALPIIAVCGVAVVVAYRHRGR